MKKNPPAPIARACRLEAGVAREQSAAAMRRADALRGVATARLNAARTDQERAPFLTTEARLAEREAVLHAKAARVYQAEARRADAQADAEDAIQLRKSTRRR